jgi:O-antigen ligase
LGGIISFVAELALILAILVLPDRRSGRNLLLMGIMCALLAGSLLALHPVGLARRLTHLRQPLDKDTSAARISVLLDSAKMVRQKPVLGWGFGTFPVVYPSFRSFYSDFWVNQAHNDYIQSLVETGLLGFGAVIMFLALFYRSGLKQTRKWRESLTASIKLGALVGCTGLLIHGLFDFNLQVPANAALFFALAAVAVTAHDGKPRSALRTQT